MRSFFIMGLPLLAALFLLPPSTVGAAEIEGVSFASEIDVNGTRLELRGVGLLRHLVFIKAYVGALYTEQGAEAKDYPADIAKRLEVEYFHDLKGEDFGLVTDKFMARNVDRETLERLRPRIDRHNALYVDIEAGERYSLTYIPGKGTELALNGQPLGVVKGADFAAALFSMWLGEKPMNAAFKRQLMKQIDDK